MDCVAPYGSTATTTTITGLNNGTLYQFDVMAINGVGTSSDSNLASTRPMGVLFQETFESLTNGSISGQNGWVLGGSTGWTVGPGNGGKIVTRDSSGQSSVCTFQTDYIANGASSYANQRVQVDFMTPSTLGSGTYIPQVWLRRSASSGDGGGYFVYQLNGSWQIATHAANAGCAFTDQVTAAQTITTNTWYRFEAEAVNDTNGNPVVRAWIYPVGSSRSAAPLLTWTDTSKTFASGFFGLGSNQGSNPIVNYDNVVVNGTTNDDVQITAPARAVVGAPTTATLAIVDEPGASATFYIPYIQTSTTLSVSATVGPSILPSNGGVKFTLNAGLPSERSIVVMSSPFSASFTALAKGIYTLDAYVVNASQVVQTGGGRHDQAISIGIGDIITAVGDSITAGHNGADYATTTVWTAAAAGSVSTDNRNYPQHGPGPVGTNGRYRIGYLRELNNELTSYYGYPVFIMNEGRYGYTSQEYINYMAESQWSSRESALSPNKALVHLSANDAFNHGGTALTPAQVQSNLQTIINTLGNTYGIASSSIFLARTSYYNDATLDPTIQTYLPKISTLVSINSLTAGPDFHAYYAQYFGTQYDDTIHPNTLGFTNMARLWAISMMPPKNLTVSQNQGTVTIGWDSLASVESSITRYYLRRGTSPGIYTATTTLSATSTTLTGLTEGQTYYFAVAGNDNDTTLPAPNTTRNSAEVSITYDTTPPVASAIAATSAASTSATVTWTTNEGASTRVEYGLTSSYTATTTEIDTLPRVTSHSAGVSSLRACTRYHYRIRSKDSGQNETVGGDNTFQTSGCIGSASIAAATNAALTTSGGIVALTSGTANFAMTVPSGAASTTATFQILQTDKTTTLGAAPTPSGFSVAVSHMYQLDALTDATTTLPSFSQPITLAITYTASDISGLSESTLKIMRWSGSAWQDTSGACSVSTSAKTVTCATTQFSLYGLFGQPSSSSGSSASSPAATPATQVGGNGPPLSLARVVTGDVPSQPLSAATSTSFVAAGASVIMFTRDLRTWDTGDDVLRLQRFLNAHGYAVAVVGPGSPGHEVSRFGRGTRRALILFQEAHRDEILSALHLKRGTGLFGPSTRAVVNRLLTIEAIQRELSLLVQKVRQLQAGVR